MLQVPTQLTGQFGNYIGKQGVPFEQHKYYLKWLRYYLDFCHKYHFKCGSDASLTAFLDKLMQKNQPAPLQRQARKAVHLY